MYYNLSRAQNILQVGDNFAHLKTVMANDDMVFEFTYAVSQSQVIKNKALTVDVSVFTRTVKKTSMMGSQRQGGFNAKQVMGNILTQMSDAKTAAKNQENYVLASRKSDITAHINNEIVGKLVAGVSKENIQPMYRSSLELVSAGSLKKDNDERPVFHMLAHPSFADVYTEASSSVTVDTRLLRLDMIVRQGIDPSSISNMTHRSVPATDMMQGTLRPTKLSEVAFSPATKLLNSHVINASSIDAENTSMVVDDEQLMHVIVNKPIDNVDVPVIVTIPASKKTLKNSDGVNVFVKFELRDASTGAAIDSVVKSLNLMKHVKVYRTPKKAPIVNVTKAELSSRANLEIKQIDRGANAVNVYQKLLSHVSVVNEGYTLIGTYNVSASEQSLFVPVAIPKRSTMIYRVIPVGNGVQGFEFSNVVVNPVRYTPIKSITVTSTSTVSGILIEVRNIPPTVSSVQILRRNMTIHESDAVAINEPVFIDAATRQVDSSTYLDQNVQSGNIYEYSAMIYHRSGTAEASGNSIIEYVRQQEGKVDTRVENVVISHDVEPNVVFDVTTSTLDSTVDVILALLTKQGTLSFFSSDLAREREALKGLIAHDIKRVDLTTGKVESFGVITITNFSDAAFRKNNAIEPLRYGHKYRYEVSALLRAPETMLETLRKVMVDPVTKKTYEYVPSKFFHPIALNEGTLVTFAGLKTRYAKDPMQHGLIGTTTTFDVSFDSTTTVVIDAAASRFDRHLNSVTWRLSGSSDNVDHFLIMKEVHNIRTVVGKVHSNFSNGNCQFLHAVTNRDVGSLTYVITPVFNDYSSGEPVTTNAVII